MNKKKKEYVLPLVSQFEKEAKPLDVMMSDNTTIRVFTTKAPADKRNGYTLLIISGWGTVLPSWDELLIDAIKDFDIVYFESREKGSSSFTRKSDLGMHRMALDIKDTITNLELDESKLVLFGSCLGATMIVYGMVEEMYKPFMPVLLAPPGRFEVPPVLRQLIPFLPTFIAPVLKPIIRFWINKFKTEDRKQAAKYIRAMEEADAKRWKRLGLRLAYKRYWKTFPRVKNHVLLIAAERDKMHDAEDTKKVSKMIKNSTYLDLETNRNTHSGVMVDTIREYLPKFEGKN
ncbi:MAG: alpha/beta hydrolase [Candidatus Heimdallarchaeota archaeon]|nr:alpha/beta hydrolase [Candidatus Heimdallarchaeota archaeon]MCK5144298.1 alpha/beta hydrolase [Candidatus Heimdallarchaeota archaeon]